jgi:pyruvate/2-oxoglutarate dehydrogenase complex dihydrolipoamide dehydrogenase (E3) component
VATPPLKGEGAGDKLIVSIGRDNTIDLNAEAVKLKRRAGVVIDGRCHAAIKRVGGGRRGAAFNAGA